MSEEANTLLQQQSQDDDNWSLCGNVEGYRYTPQSSVLEVSEVSSRQKSDKKIKISSQEATRQLKLAKKIAREKEETKPIF